MWGKNNKIIYTTNRMIEIACELIKPLPETKKVIQH